MRCACKALSGVRHMERINKYEPVLLLLLCRNYSKYQSNPLRDLLVLCLHFWNLTLENCSDPCPHPPSSPAPWCLLTISVQITNPSSHTPSPLSPRPPLPCWLHGPPFLVLPALLFVPSLEILCFSADLHAPLPTNPFSAPSRWTWIHKGAGRCHQSFEVSNLCWILILESEPWKHPFPFLTVALPNLTTPLNAPHATPCPPP